MGIGEYEQHDKVPPDSKGKGRGQEKIGTGKQQQSASGSLASSIMQSARSSVNPSTLSNLMTANGKSSVGLPSSSRPSEPAFECIQQSSTSQPILQFRQLPVINHQSRNASFQSNSDDAYNQFAEMGTSRIDLGIQEQLRSESSAFIGPFSSAQELDVPLHDHVRRFASQWSEMDDAWTSHSGGTNQGETSSSYDHAYDEAWAQSIPVVSSARFSDMQRGQNIDELLQTVSLIGQPAPRGTIMNAGNGPSTDIMSLLEEEERVTLAPLPTQEIAEEGMTEEQVQMHSALDALQKSEERAEERIQPPNDDAIARTGIYAATPQEALQAIWDGPAEGKRASTLVRNDTRSSEESISKKIRELLKRGSYVDDVYGIPPQLQKTIVAAEEEETEENKERRNMAIRRLDALYKHLGAAGPLPPFDAASVDDFIRVW